MWAKLSDTQRANRLMTLADTSCKLSFTNFNNIFKDLHRTENLPVHWISNFINYQ